MSSSEDSAFKISLMISKNPEVWKNGAEQSLICPYVQWSNLNTPAPAVVLRRLVPVTSTVYKVHLLSSIRSVLEVMATD